VGVDNRTADEAKNRQALFVRDASRKELLELRKNWDDPGSKRLKLR
jgi:hypothetical protein